MSVAVKVGGAVGKYGTRAVLGLGYIALRGAYALGEAGEAAVEAGSLEAEALGLKHEKLMTEQRAANAVKIAEMKAQIAATRAQRMVDESATAAPIALAA